MNVKMKKVEVLTHLQTWMLVNSNVGRLVTGLCEDWLELARASQEKHFYFQKMRDLEIENMKLKEQLGSR